MPNSDISGTESPDLQVLWHGSQIQEWAKATLQGPTPSLARSAVPVVTELREIPGGPFTPRIAGGSASYGHQGLRERLAQLYEASAENILLAQGASQANFLIAGALLEQGGTAVVESPVYEPVLRGIEMLADRVMRLPRRAERNYQPDPRELAGLLTADTKLVWLTNLHNPTQTALEMDHFAALVAACDKVGAQLIVDEVYLNFIQPDFRAHAFTHGAISVNSLDKTWGLDQLRVGWAVAPAKVVERAYKFNNLMGVVQPYVTEDLADQILRSEAALSWFQLRRNTACGQMRLLMAFLKSTPELKLLPPSGGVNACLQLPGSLNDMQFSERLRTERGVTVFPGSLFELPGYIRVSIGGDPVEVRQHLTILGEAVREWR
ncbi:MAG: pyridoxal phosphate-dependent aminotransferase [bacterium]|nr:pyridoxal phosphate-dependent aminotransferase [bacterium]